MDFPTQDHIDAAQLAADHLWASTGFYCWPSASLAQTIIESNYGKQVSGRNNFHGIKATPAQIAAGDYTLCPTFEIIEGRRVKVMGKFANFSSLADSYEQHAMLFLRVKLYAEGLKAKDAVSFIRAIAPFYATAEKDPDPKKRYSTIVIKLMTDRNLYRFDKPVNERGKAVSPPKPVSPPIPDVPAQVGPALPPPKTSWWSLLVSLFSRK